MLFLQSGKRVYLWKYVDPILGTSRIDLLNIIPNYFYSKLCDFSMTCFEEETKGNLVQGLEFHKFYMENGRFISVNSIYILSDNLSHEISRDWRELTCGGSSAPKTYDWVQCWDLAPYIFSILVHSKRTTPINTTLLTPYVHVLSDESAAICYVRLTQYLDRYDDLCSFYVVFYRFVRACHCEVEKLSLTCAELQ